MMMTSLSSCFPKLAFTLARPFLLLKDAPEGNRPMLSSGMIRCTWSCGTFSIHTTFVVVCLLSALSFSTFASRWAVIVFVERQLTADRARIAMRTKLDSLDCTAEPIDGEACLVVLCRKHFHDLGVVFILLLGFQQHL